MIKLRTVLLASALGSMALLASAQVYVSEGYSSSTAAEGAAQGLASVVSAAGSYNLQTSEAAKNYQQARSAELDNNLKTTQTYFDMRKVNRDARAAEAGPKLTFDDYSRMAKAGSPTRLTASQLDPVTGKINWPIILHDKRFWDDIRALNGLFQKRVTSGQLDYTEYNEIRDHTNSLLDILKQGINDFEANDYIPARRFVLNLAYESKFPPG